MPSRRTGATLQTWRPRDALHNKPEQLQETLADPVRREKLKDQLVPALMTEEAFALFERQMVCANGERLVNH